MIRPGLRAKIWAMSQGSIRLKAEVVATKAEVTKKEIKAKADIIVTWSDVALKNVNYKFGFIGLLLCLDSDRLHDLSYFHFHLFPGSI